jgi:CubicO group peptidase (beta-lactamase class C family)
MLTSFTPGTSISVSVDGEIVYSEGLGLASKELNAPVLRNTKFRIGSTSQMFTSYLVLRMQEKGLLDVDSSFYQYIPNFPKKQADFTVRQLAAQAAGFPESRNEDFQNDKELRTLKDYVKKFEKDSLIYEPDTYFLKSDYSTALLGIMAEHISKENYSKLIREMVLDTLQLENTLLDNLYAIIPGRSEFYHRDYIARLINAPETNLLPVAPALGFLSTADDLNRAAQKLLKPGFFSQDNIDLMITPHTLKTGQQLNRSFGWIAATDREGRKLTAQLGSTIGGSSAVVVYPGQKLVVSICSNLGDDMEELPLLNVASHFLDQLDPKEKETNAEKESEKENGEGPAE